ncbi:hypothetical protein FTX61_13420 [Nitriliruptoraceae bacterium ZYF776]|nr:hypothetical protein [Profundirhabdus halotolerans]
MDGHRCPRRPTTPGPATVDAEPTCRWLSPAVSDDRGATTSPQPDRLVDRGPTAVAAGRDAA